MFTSMTRFQQIRIVYPKLGVSVQGQKTPLDMLIKPGAQYEADTDVDAEAGNYKNESYSSFRVSINTVNEA